MTTCLKVAQELRPGGLSFANEDNVCMRLRFVRYQSHMRSAQNHRNSPRPKAVCHGIHVRCTRSMKGNCDQVGLHFEIDWFHCLINMQHCPMRRNESGQIRHGDLLKVEDAGAPYLLDLR